MVIVRGTLESGRRTLGRPEFGQVSVSSEAATPARPDPLMSSAPNPEAAQAASFPPLALLTFASSAFVPIETQPGWLQVFSAHQPLTAVVDAVRALVLGGPTLTPVLQSIAWSVGIIAVFAPIAVARYRRTG